MISLSHHDAEHASRCGHDAWRLRLAVVDDRLRHDEHEKPADRRHKRSRAVTTGGTGTGRHDFR